MFQAPRPAQIPHLQTMLDNIGRNDADLAKFLNISASTLRKYRLKGQAPRSVMLALFWETVWGQSAANCHAVNNARLNFTKNVMLQRQILQMQKQIDRLQAELDKSATGAANSPVFEAR